MMFYYLNVHFQRQRVNHGEDYNRLFETLKGKYSAIVERIIQLVSTNVFIVRHLSLNG